LPLRGRRRDDILPGLRVIGFERRVNIAFVVTTDALLIEGIFYGGRNYEAILREQK
jgi:toxin ParE1/3/4